MGTPDYATSILEALIDSSKFDVIALFCQPDRAVGRDRVLTPPDTKNYILENSINIDIHQPDRLKDSTEKIRELNPDFIVVAAYGQILPKAILDIAPCINLHASILPKYRGASPIQTSLINQDRFTGVTAMLMDEGLDSGDILAIKYIEIKEKMRVDELFKALSKVASELTITTLENFDSILPIAQNGAISTHCKKIKRSDGEINFSESANSIYSKFRAFYFWPEIFLKSGLKLKEIEIENSIKPNRESENGEILAIESEYIIISTEFSLLRVYRVQPKSKKSMDINSYLRGKRLKVGDYLS